MTTTDELTQLLKTNGASLVGFADLSVLPPQVRCDLPRAVAFAVALRPEIIACIKDGPTKEYHGEYVRANDLLGELSESAAELLRHRGFSAISSAATDEGIEPETLSTQLPQKTVATLAGFGWIGKCALLVTKDFGSAVRLNRVLTDAELPVGTPVIESRCGDCRACVDACPGRAATGDDWHPNKHRDEFFDAFACRRSALATAQYRTRIQGSFCGICIAACPWTERYIQRSTQQPAQDDG